ncbi:MAG: outer membrane lipoprotein carrier protein LolA [Alphaproteobacteria bacterium]|nr:outer membrane lipoprotein carrier protein LolA [Alphaproteobacteria bacterium]
MSIIVTSIITWALSGFATEGASAGKEIRPLQGAFPSHHREPGSRIIRVQLGPGAPPPASRSEAAAKEKSVAPAAPSRTSIIKSMSDALIRVKTAQGKFIQADNQGTESRGAFYISRPGKVRFDYSSPEPITIVSDGVTVSIEEPRRDAYDAVPLASTPLNLFLRNSIDLSRDGSVKSVTSRGSSHFITLEDASGQSEGQMILEFRASDFELLGWTSIDANGDQTRVRLSDVRTNVALKPSLFIVRDPADEDDRRN